MQPTLLLMLLKKRKQSKRPLAGSGTAAIDWVTGSPPVGALIKAEGYGSFSNDTSLIPAAQRATCLHGWAARQESRWGLQPVCLPYAVCYN